MTFSGPVVDPHVHLRLDDGMAMAGRPQEPADYLARMAEVDLRAAGVLVMAPRDDMDRTRHQNDLVLELAQQDPWYPMCSVHPADGDAALVEVDRVADAGAKGLKLHPNTQAFDVADEAVAQVVRHAGERGLPVLFDAFSPTDPAQPGKFMVLAMKCPDTQLVLAHMHAMKFPELLVYEILARYPEYRRNVWFDMSATATLFAGSPFADQLAWVSRKVGVDRLLWASDFPMDDPREALDAVRTGYDFADDELSAICHDNAARLYGLSGEPPASAPP